MLQQDTMSHEDAEAFTDYLIIDLSPAAGPAPAAPSPAGSSKPQGYGQLFEWLIIRSQSGAPAPAPAAAKYKSPSTGSQGTGAQAPSKAQASWNRITNTEPMSGISASTQAWNLPSPATYPLQSLLVYCPVSSAVQRVIFMGTVWRPHRSSLSCHMQAKCFLHSSLLPSRSPLLLLQRPCPAHPRLTLELDRVGEGSGMWRDMWYCCQVVSVLLASRSPLLLLQRLGPQPTAPMQCWTSTLPWRSALITC